MKKIMIVFAAIVLFAGCGTQFDDSYLNESISELEFRLSVLEDRCRRINTNITALQRIVEKSPEKDRINSVTPIYENEVLAGYVITYVFGDVITVYCATDGTDGIDGHDGKDGKDGQVPDIGIKVDDGVKYWTLSGEYILDDKGNRIPLIRYGGQSSDGRTPILKIEGGAWYYSMDSGTSWTKMDVSVCYGSGNIFKSVTQNDTEVLFTLADGTVISFPKSSDISLSVSQTSLTIPAGQSGRISYTVEGADNETEVDAFASGGWRVTVEADGKDKGQVVFTAPASSEEATAVVYATASTGLSVYKTIKLSVQ